MSENVLSKFYHVCLPGLVQTRAEIVYRGVEHDDTNIANDDTFETLTVGDPPVVMKSWELTVIEAQVATVTMQRAVMTS